MTSFRITVPLDCRNSGLLALARQTWRNALATGALQPISTEGRLVDDGRWRFSLRWLSSLALKERARVAVITRREQSSNPFLPPEAALVVCRLNDSHVVILNKYPVIEDHLLIITRQFKAQTDALESADFRALASVLQAEAGLGFYNGGAIAGASQAHKHLQWIPDQAFPGTGGLGAFTGGLERSRVQQVQHHPDLPWQHAFVSLDDCPWSELNAAAAALEAAFARAWETLDCGLLASPMPPYNLLVSREWLLLVPRQHEKWQDISVNALGYAGSLFVRDAAQIERLCSEGPLAVLAAVGFPR